MSATKPLSELFQEHEVELDSNSAKHRAEFLAIQAKMRSERIRVNALIKREIAEGLRDKNGSPIERYDDDEEKI